MDTPGNEAPTEVPVDREILDLRDYLSIVWTRKRTIIAIVVVTALVAVGYSMSRPRAYTSSAEVQVEPVSFTPSQTPGTLVSLNMTTEVQVAQSSEVKEIALDHLGVRDSDAGTLAVDQVPDAETLLFTAEATEPRTAMATAQAYAEAYLELRHTNALDELEGARAPYEDQLREIDARIAEIRDQVRGAGTAEQVLLAGTLGQLNAQRVSILSQLNALIEPENLQVGRVLRSAELPETPSRPHPARDGLIAIFVGFALGIGVAFIRDRLEEPVRGRGQLETYAGAPVLAFVPPSGEGRLFKSQDGRASSTAEAFKTLRVRLLLVAQQRDSAVILITSSMAREGKTTVTASLGRVMAEAGKRVVIVSADLRKPRMQTHFPPRRDGAGLTQLLKGSRRATKTLAPVKEVKNLWVLHAGRDIASIDPSEVLGSDSMRRALDELRGFADFVLIDTPPLLLTPDVLSLAPMTDGALLVVDAQLAQQPSVEQARHELELTGVPILGLVVSNHDPARFRAFGTGYGYYIERPVPPKEQRDSHQPESGSDGDAPGRDGKAVSPDPVIEMPSSGTEDSHDVAPEPSDHPSGTEL
jgi:capsular exopolysaccharide synthesis family protein